MQACHLNNRIVKASLGLVCGYVSGLRKAVPSELGSRMIQLASVQARYGPADALCRQLCRTLQACMLAQRTLAVLQWRLLCTKLTAAAFWGLWVACRMHLGDKRSCQEPMFRDRC